MATLVLSPSEVRQLLPMSRCIELMGEVLATLGRGEATNPLRWVIPIGDTGRVLGMMPGSLETPAAVGLKVIAIYPENHGSIYDSHQGVVMLFDPDHGVPLAILDASEITAIRTAAVSGLATNLLARRDATRLAILGSGVQARTHLQAMREVREIDHVRVFSPSIEHRCRFAQRESERHGIEVEPVESPREAVADAHIICTVTASKEPIVSGDWIAPGAHVNAVGASTPKTRELDSTAVARARLYVDRRESTLKESGDFLFAKRSGAVGDSHILAELGELLLGQATGRRSDEDVTLFKSLGLAVEDLMAANYVLNQARENGVGTEVQLGGERDASA